MERQHTRETRDEEQASAIDAAIAGVAEAKGGRNPLPSIRYDNFIMILVHFSRSFPLFLVYHPTRTRAA